MFFEEGGEVRFAGNPVSVKLVFNRLLDGHGNVTCAGQSYAHYNASEAGAYSVRWGEALVRVIDQAAPYHDVGKLDPLMQEVLRTNSRNVTGYNHVEAGTAYLVLRKLYEAALTDYSHHLGLPSLPEEKAKGPFCLRDPKPLIGLNQTSWQRTDQLLSTYLTEHRQYFSEPIANGNEHFRGLVRRLALSCLVDADHSDTVQNYLSERELSGEPLRPLERLASLDSYVTALERWAQDNRQTESESLRTQLRSDIYRACREADLAESIAACAGEVGIGKTTAVMAHLLRTAARRGLRHILVVLPFTHIIDQAVDVYRKALTLPGEDPERIVAAHHHRVEFNGDSWRDLRQLTQRWDCPIIVTTAVQFFESLAGCRTGRLRKLHQLPGSGIFIDESHAAIPAALWP